MLICPQCQSTNIKKNGKTKLCYQQYRCKDCKKNWSDNPNGIGRPTKYEQPMTDAQRSKEYRQKLSR